LAEKCSDGTKLGACSKNRPKYCFDGILVLRCSKCGCPRGYECVEERCEKKTQEKKTNTSAGIKEASKPEVKNKSSLAFKNNTVKKTSADERVDEIEENPVEHPLEEEDNLTERQPEDYGSFTGSAIISKAANPKAVVTIAFSMLFGVYILHKKRRQDVKMPEGSI
jgi:hypothetical protein